MLSYDNHPQVPGGDAPIVGRFPAYSNVGTIECLVVGRRYVDEPGNRLRNAVVYDVRNLATGQVMPAVPALQTLHGLANGGEGVYHPATKNLRGGVFDGSTRASDTDGDIVLVGFVGGVYDRPVILGALAHPEAPYGAKAEDGERRFVIHQGTRIQVRKDGSAEVDREGTKVEITASGDVLVDHKDGSKVHCEGSVVKLDGTAVAGIILGFQAADAVIRGTTFDATVAKPLAVADVAAASTVLDLAATVIASPAPFVTKDQFATLLAILGTYLGAEASAMSATTAALSKKVVTE